MRPSGSAAAGAAGGEIVTSPHKHDGGLPTQTLTLVSTQTAVTYSFRTEFGPFGWASCTVNDTTGELLITSSWGNWAHRWDPQPSCLGAPNLTMFIGSRGDVDYLARKLQGDAGRRWSTAATVTALRRQLCERRLKDGREQLEARLDPDEIFAFEASGGNGHYDEHGLPLFSGRWVDAPTWNDRHRREQLPYLTRDTARQLWSEIGRLAESARCSSDLFYARVQQIDGFTDYVTEEPWQYGETEQTSADRALREIVLPALITVCRDRATTPAPTAPAPNSLLPEMPR